MKFSVAFVVAVAGFVSAQEELTGIDAKFLSVAGYPECSIKCAQEAHSKSVCGIDIRCQCLADLPAIQDAVTKCVAAAGICKEPTDDARIRIAGRSMCAAFGIQKRSAAPAPAATSTATATTTTTSVTTANSPGSKPTSSSPPPKASAPALAVPGMVGLLGMAAVVAL